MSRPLFEIGADLIRVIDAMEEETYGEYDPLDAYFAAILDEEARKLDDCSWMLEQWDMEENAAQAQIDQWTAKRDRRRRWKKSMKDRLLGHLVATGRTKATTASGRTISVTANGGLLPLVFVEGEIVPDDFKRWIPEPHKEAIRKALDAGEVLPFAHLGERGSHLRFRV